MMLSKAQSIQLTGHVLTHQFQNQPIKVWIQNIKTLKIDTLKINAYGQFEKQIQIGTYKVYYEFNKKKELLIKEMVFDSKNKQLSLNFKSLEQSTIQNQIKNKPVSKKIEEVSKYKSIVTPSLSRSASEDTEVKEMSVDIEKHETKKDQTYKAGQITAGHWRDLDHWNDWLITNQDPKVLSYQKTWGFKMQNQFRILIEDKDGWPLPFVKMILKNETNQTIWAAHSNQNGEAYFWHNTFDSSVFNNLILEIHQHQEVKTIKNIKSYINSKKAIRLNKSKEKINTLEIGFVVDATGSMGDEINFLKSELIDVMNRVQKKNQCLNIKTGSVFYKDKYDDYITKTSPLSSNFANTIQFISEQYAGGGGDFPEAVDLAMEAAINNLGWSQTQNPKLLFLLLDAPPHQNKESIEKIHIYTQKAAALGIRIIPIAASGINQSTEFLMKYMAMCTNGEYVYITDDSKIGNSHIKPTGGESKVTFLNDLLVKIINNYNKGNWCDEENLNDSQMIEQDDQTKEFIIGNQWNFCFMPNPARYLVEIKVSEMPDRVQISDLNGKILFESETKTLNYQIDVTQWNSGMYVVRVFKGQEQLTGKLIVMH